MTKLELIQSIIKHRQAGAGMCSCVPLRNCGNAPKVVDAAGGRSDGAHPAFAGDDNVRQG